MSHIEALHARDVEAARHFDYAMRLTQVFSYLAGAVDHALQELPADHPAARALTDALTAATAQRDTATRTWNPAAAGEEQQP